MSDYLTQPVTAKDIAAGQIRLPITNKVKSLFASERSDVRILLRGREMTVYYDPRIGADRERSGLLRIGRAVMSTGIVGENERLTVTPGDPIRLE